MSALPNLSLQLNSGVRRLVQVKSDSRDRWTSGDSRDIATFTAARVWIDSIFESPKQQGTENGLGKWVAWGGTLPSGEQIEVIHYFDSPSTEHEYLIRGNVSSDPKAVLEEFLRLDRTSEIKITRRSDGHVA